jgi:hypothetical protein
MNIISRKTGERQISDESRLSKSSTASAFRFLHLRAKGITGQILSMLIGINSRVRCVNYFLADLIFSDWFRALTCSQILKRYG